MFKLALIQMYVEAGNKQKNLSHAEKLINEAASNGADLVVLPEAMNLGWTDISAKTDADPIPEGQSCRILANAARKNKVFICCGLVEKSHDKIFNSAVIINGDGDIVLYHRKINELEIAHHLYEQGSKLNVCHTELGTLGLMICADGLLKDRLLARSLCCMGAEVIISPCSWAVSDDHDNSVQPYGAEWYGAYVPVAKEFSVWIAGVSNVGYITSGPWKGKKCIGCSLVIGPDGREAAKGSYGPDAEEIIYVDVEPVKSPRLGCS